jgi:hypothetical protein
VSRRKSFIEDQRGAAALEMPFVWGFLMLGLLLPLADLTIAGVRFISAYQALRNMGQFAQYRPPPSDVTSSTSITNWQNSLPPVDGYTVSAQVYCGYPPSPTTLAPCASTALPPYYYIFSTSFTFSPIIPMLQSVLCSTCTVSYSQRFQ